jgi:predicted acylesterase/phospholipase RssA
MAALLLPAALFLALALFRPPQYQFVLVDASARVWPFTFAMLIVAASAVCTLWALRAEERLTPLFAGLAATPLAAAAASGWWVAGVTPNSILAFAGAAVILILAYWVLRMENFWGRVPRHLRMIWAPLITALFIYFTFGLASSLDPLDQPRALGAFAIFAVFVGILGVFFCASVLRPKFGLLLLSYIVIAGLLFGPNDHGIPPAQAKAKASPTDAGEALGRWLQNRKDLETYRLQNRPYPVILVSSEGGGIYAAAHAYGTLSVLAQACPTFAQHIFAAVGVSGGAIGNALFASGLDPAQKPHTPCRPTTAKVDPRPVITDHLSPVLARLLLIEPVDLLLPGRWMTRDRAQILTDSFFSVSHDKSYLRAAISDSFDPRSARPALISVAVDIADGRRLVMAPIQPSEFAGTGIWWPRGAFFQEHHAEPEISVLDAAGVSARFPWITPTGRLKISAKDDIILADGGYFDNSGADTVLDLILDFKAGQDWEEFSPSESDETGAIASEPCTMPQIRFVKNFHENIQWGNCTVPIFILHLALASREWATTEGETPRRPVQSFLFDPISALLATRESRAEIALARADLDACGTGISGAECFQEPGRSIGFFRNDISPVEWRLPLGWYMPAHGFQRVLQNTAPASIFDYRRLKQEADFDRDLDTKLLIYHLDPDLYSDDASPTLGDLMPDP